MSETKAPEGAPKAAASSVAQSKAAVEKKAPETNPVKYRLKNSLQEVGHPTLNMTIMNEHLQGEHAHYAIAAIKGQDAKGKTKDWYGRFIEEYR